MSGVSVDTNPTPSMPADFTAAIDGGENFLKRLSLLQQEKKKHDDALAALGVGQDVAKAKADVEQKNALADQQVIDAQAKADKLVKDAQEKAKKILAEAEAHMEEARGTSEDILTHARQVNEDATNALNQAHATKAQAEQTAAEAETIKQAHLKAHAEALEIRKVADAKEAEFSAKLQKFAEFTASMGK